MYSSSNQKINLALAKVLLHNTVISDTKLEFQFSILLVKGKEHQNSAA